MTFPEPIPPPVEAPHRAAAETPVTTPRDFERRVLGLAAPVIGENLLQTMLGVVDTVLVAGLGAVALAGIGTALQVIFVLIGALSALSVGASVQVAHGWSRWPSRAGRHVRLRGALRGTGNTRTPLVITGVVIVCPARSSPSTMPPVLSLASWNAPAW